MPQAKDLKVYLDRHIRRDNLLYTPSTSSAGRDDSREPQSRLQLTELFGDESKDDLLRKPDFQRATSAWSPEECVSLLVSVLKEQVIPSIIMWRVPNKHLWYVLDGAHRLSVVLAWIRDDWGENLGSDIYVDSELEQTYKEGAKKVRKLLAGENIRPFKEYKEAYKAYKNTHDYTDSYDYFEFGMNNETTKLIEFFNSLKENPGLPLQWVPGDYKKAKESFLNINKSGRKLTEWERKLVDYQDSSLARTVMSVANTSNAMHCWPNQHDPNIPTSGQQEIKKILEESVYLHKLLFEPAYDPTFGKSQQPLLVESRTEPNTSV